MLHDTLELFGASLDQVRGLWVDEVRPRMAVETARRVETGARELFANVTDTIRDAVRMPQHQTPTPENIRLACHYGLEEILGTVGSTG